MKRGRSRRRRSLALLLAMLAGTMLWSPAGRAAESRVRSSEAGPVAAVSSRVFADVSPSARYQTTDILSRTNAGEPSIGVNWKTGAVMYMAGTQVSRVTFRGAGLGTKATWKNVTPLQQGVVNEDAILFTDRRTGRTFAEGLLLAGSNGAYTDNDGKTWTQDQGFPVPHSPDHESVGVGPYPSNAPPGARATGYPNAVYYCSQNILGPAGAFCGRSDTGGLTYGPSTLVFGATTRCGAIHGHIKVAPDGTVYVPQNSCYRKDLIKGQGMAVSRNAGLTWTYSVVPGSTARPPNAGTDPSVGVGTHGAVYFGYEDGSGKAKIAVSHDHGRTWSHSVDVGAPFGIRNSKFPEVVAGDDNRAAYAFLGTSTRGDDQSPSFRGVWYMYVSYTYDGGRTWHTVNATPGDPVQRGCIWNGGGSNACRNLLDFNDAALDKQGRVLVAFTEGCANINFTYNSITGVANGIPDHGPSRCDSKPSSYSGRDKVALVALVRQACGRTLFAKYDGLLSDCGGG